MAATLGRGLGRGQGGVPPSPSYRCALPTGAPSLLTTVVPAGACMIFCGSGFSRDWCNRKSAAANEEQQAPLGQQSHRLDLRPQLLAFVQAELVA